MQDTSTPTDLVRRNAILDAAGEVFLTHGYEGATTSEIARVARTSKRALYQHFGSKQDMLDELIRSRSLAMQGPVDLPPPASRTAFFETLRQFGVAFLARFLDATTVALYRLAISEPDTGRGVGRALKLSGHAPVEIAVRRYIEQGAAKGYVAPDAVDGLSEVFLSVLAGGAMMGQLLRSEPPLTMEAQMRRAALAVAAIEQLSQTGDALPGQS